MLRRNFLRSAVVAGLAAQLPRTAFAAVPNQSGLYRFFDRNIPDLAHAAVQRMVPNWIADVAFTPSGGWVAVAGNGAYDFRGIPQECSDRLVSFIHGGERIQCIAFPPAGGNRWVILSERALFARNIPDNCYDMLLARLNAGDELFCVAFTPGSGWVILTSAGGWWDGDVSQECRNTIASYSAAGQVPHHIAFTPSGGWTLLGRSNFFARNIPQECFDNMLDFEREGRRVTHVAFEMDGGGGWHVSSNDLLALPVAAVGAGLSAVPTAMWAHRVPGTSVACLRSGAFVAQHTYGQPQRGDGRTVATNTRFQCASISKTVTAVGIMVAIRQGLIASLDSDLRPELDQTIPNEAGAGHVAQPLLSPRRLMAHSAGVVMLNSDNSVRGGFDGYARGLSTPSTAQILAGSAPSNSPRAQCRPANVGTHVYCGQNQVILQHAIECITGESFADWIRTNVLDPIGMTSSRFVLDPTWGDALEATGHDADGHPIARRRRQYPEFAAAGLWTTPTDLARLGSVINRRGLLANNTRLFNDNEGAAMHTAQAGSATCGLFASGTGANLVLTHGGANAGFRALFWLRPNANGARPGNNVLVVMGNHEPSTTNVPWQDTMRDAYINQYGI